MSTQQTMSDILNYFLERETVFEERELDQIRNFLNKVNRPNQMIRLIDRDGNRIMSVSNAIPEDWTAPLPVANPQTSISRDPDPPLLIMRSPLTIFQFNGTVEIVKSLQDFDQLNSAILRFMIVFGLGGVVLCGLGGGLLAWQLLKPLQSMAQTIRNIKQRGLHERMRLNNKQDEIGTLMRMFNTMMDQVERSFRQQSQFVEDASHELRTPIAIIEGHLSLLQRWGKQDRAVMEESLNASIQELRRLKGLIKELLTLTRAEKEGLGEGQPVTRPEEAVRSILGNVSLIYPAIHLDLDWQGKTEVTIGITQEHLEQLLLILLDNAVKYSVNSNAVQVRGLVDKDSVRLEIIDKGRGIPAEDLPYVWDRFYRVDKSRSRGEGGHGLGLSIAKRLVERYDGSIDISSREKEGTTVIVSFSIVRLE